MTTNFRALADVDRVIHQPARTMIIAILSNLESADFLFLQRESGPDKGKPFDAFEQAGRGWIHPD